MEFGVTVQIDGSDVRAGTLYAHARRGVESASFRYDGSYLADPRSFPLAPDMPLTEGSLHTQGESMFRVLGGWRKAASANGISKVSIEYMASCFESAVERLSAIR